MSTKRVLKNIIKNEGIQVFSKGLGARMLVASIYASVWFPVYEHFKGVYGINLDDWYGVKF